MQTAILTFWKPPPKTITWPISTGICSAGEYSRVTAISPPFPPVPFPRCAGCGQFWAASWMRLCAFLSCSMLLKLSFTILLLSDSTGYDTALPFLLSVPVLPETVCRKQKDSVWLCNGIPFRKAIQSPQPSVFFIWLNGSHSRNVCPAQRTDVRSPLWIFPLYGEPLYRDSPLCFLPSYHRGS